VILIKPGVPDTNGNIYTEDALRDMASAPLYIDKDGNLCTFSYGFSAAEQMARDIDRQIVQEIEDKFSMGCFARQNKCPICAAAEKKGEPTPTPIFKITDQKLEPYPMPSCKLLDMEEEAMEKHGVEKDETKTKTASTQSGKCPQCGGELSKEDAWGPITGGAYIEHCPKCGTEPFEKKREED
jgi:endogenous inhibitor of DNA gyrase (YacG/DUF329 family)